MLGVPDIAGEPGFIPSFQPPRNTADSPPVTSASTAMSPKIILEYLASLLDEFELQITSRKVSLRPSPGLIRVLNPQQNARKYGYRPRSLQVVAWRLLPNQVRAANNAVLLLKRHSAFFFSRESCSPRAGIRQFLAAYTGHSICPF